MQSLSFPPPPSSLRGQAAGRPHHHDRMRQCPQPGHPPGSALLRRSLCQPGCVSVIIAQNSLTEEDAQEGMVLFARNAASKPADSWSIAPITASSPANAPPPWVSPLLSVPRPTQARGSWGGQWGLGSVREWLSQRPTAEKREGALGPSWLVPPNRHGLISPSSASSPSQEVHQSSCCKYWERVL